MSNYKTILAAIFLLSLLNCTNNPPSKKEESHQVTTPVTVISVKKSTIGETVTFNAVSMYQRKNFVKSNINGYVEKSFINQGDIVQAGDRLYSIKTKEGDALSKLNISDTSYHFNGRLSIVAPTSGVILEANKQTNDYLNDGEQLCVIASQSSFVFILNVPYEQNKYASSGRKCTIILPDSTVLSGTVSGKLATVDPASQTQGFIVRPATNVTLPENLSVLVQINKSVRENTQIIDKSCILADETMENFWLMKLINDTTAVKIAVKTGIVSGNSTEIVSPVFNLNDRIVNSGNYGLPDTAFVKIIQNTNR